MTEPRDHLSKAEIRKDAVQDAVDAVAGTVGEVTSILVGAVRQVAGSLGGLATELFEIRDAARRATAEHHGTPEGTEPGGAPYDVADDAE